MQVYDITLILSGRHVLTEDLAQALVAAGCDDGSPGSSQGVVKSTCAGRRTASRRPSAWPSPTFRRPVARSIA